jgi:conjugal transfer/entry exclusion protein
MFNWMRGSNKQDLSKIDKQLEDINSRLDNLIKLLGQTQSPPPAVRRQLEEINSKLIKILEPTQTPARPSGSQTPIIHVTIPSSNPSHQTKGVDPHLSEEDVAWSKYRMTDEQKQMYDDAISRNYDEKYARNSGGFTYRP